MNLLRFCVNHNNETCAVYYGTPFQYDGALMNLPKTKDGKEVIVLGLQPHTVDLKIEVDYDFRSRAQSVTSYNPPDVAIEMLKELRPVS